MAALEVDGIYVEAANDIRKGGYMVMNNGKSPCKVIEISKSKPGKHGSAKIRFMGLDIFTDRKYDALAGSHDKVDVPEVFKKDLMVTEYAEGDEEMTVKDINGASYKIPVPTGDCGETIASLWYDRESDDTSVFVTVQAAMGKLVVLSAREREIKQA
jgi:translation initiation factor 5A